MPRFTTAAKIKVLIGADQIRARCRQLAADISRDYVDEDLVLVCVLKGAMVFFVDLARELSIPVRCDCVRASSYEGQKSTREVDLSLDLSQDIEDKHVLLVEDIVDTGLTVRHLFDLLAPRRPASLRVASLLDKPSRREVEVNIDYLGFTIPNVFVVGYGLDYKQLYRNLPHIGVLEE